MQFLLNGKVPVVRIAGREVNLLVLAAATVVGMLSIYFVRKYTLETVISSLSAMAMLPQAVARVKSSWAGEGRPGLTPMKIYATCVEQTDKPSVLSDLLDGTFPLDVKLPGGVRDQGHGLGRRRWHEFHVEADRRWQHRRQGLLF